MWNFAPKEQKECNEIIHENKILYIYRHLKTQLIINAVYLGVV